MGFENIIDICSGDEMEDLGMEVGEKRPHYVLGNSENERDDSKRICNSNSNAAAMSQSGSSAIEQECIADDESSRPLCPPPICRQFWKAGNYELEPHSKAPIQDGKSHLRVHPLFLHSNATSHKWAFGAIAELLDNAIDEIKNGATFAVIDKIINPRDGSAALLIQDDGGGMDPEAIRGCMSFGFSDKKDKSSIGQYGNGFKTSSMRLGSDVIVFSRNQGNRTASQSIGLLSYTFLRQSNQVRIVVPLVDYELNPLSGEYEPVLAHGSAQFTSNMSVILQWSPFSTEEALLSQFDDVGQHGTKIIVYNLWLNDDGEMELDFDSDIQDIRINTDAKLFQLGPKADPITDQHIATRYRYSLRVYASILYRHLPANFTIMLRGTLVVHHNIAFDIKYPEFIVYKPHCPSTPETMNITTIIGFLNEAPEVNIQGFNIYHKNRLILPFWSVIKNSTKRAKARGVVGMLETNFIEPTHNKQDFEKTSLFQKLEGRLREMAIEYWDSHCQLIGYIQTKKKLPPPGASSWNLIPPREKKTYVEEPVVLNSNFSQGRKIKRKEQIDVVDLEPENTDLGSFARETEHFEDELQCEDEQPVRYNDKEMKVIHENEKLHSRLQEYETREEDLNQKIEKLQCDLEDALLEYTNLMDELESMVPIEL